MTSISLDSARRHQIWTTLLRLQADADVRFDVRRHFLPIPQHQEALRNDVFLIRGGRGMGKTTLFRTMVDGKAAAPLLGPLFQTQGPQVLDGYSPGNREHPTEDQLNAITATDERSLRAFWLGQLVRVLNECAQTLVLGAEPCPIDVGRKVDPKRLTGSALDKLHEITLWLQDVDTRLQERNVHVWVAYDALDRVPASFVAPLGALWTSLFPRLSSITPKIFLREDLFERVFAGSTDGPNLVSRSINLHWSAHDLFRLFLFTLANHEESLRLWLQQAGFMFRENITWLPPDVVPEEGTASQEQFATLLAGRFMGSGSRKGFTRRWLPRTLCDGHGAIAPRSAIWLLRGAAEDALRAPDSAEGPLFRPDHLRAGMREVSRNRVAELQTEHPVVGRLEKLRGAEVPIEEADLIVRLIENDPPRIRPSELLLELARLGTLNRRPDGRWDVPDLYRLGYEIKRKGGTPLR